MQTIKGVAFDLEGTVIDVEAFHFNGFIQAAREGGFLEIDFDTIVQKIPYAIGGGDKLIAEGIARLSGDRLDSAWICERKMVHYNQMIDGSERIKPRPGFWEVFTWLQGMGLPMTIGSLTPTRQAEILLNRSGLDCFFSREKIVLLEDVKQKKPAPDAYLETARRMGITPQEQIVFEDSATGLEAARAAGSIGIGMPVYHFPENLIKLIQAGATRIFMDWREMNISALVTNLNGFERV